MILHLDGLTVDRGTLPVIAQCSATFAPGLTAIIGPSGIGKSTLLRAIAGLIAIREGRVLLDHNDLAPVPPQRRNIGMVFQEPTLFPHLHVRGNVEFGLRMRGVRSAERKTRARAMLRAVGLESLEQRAVDTLSGGQAHRVALARALAIKPPLLLLDEPLGGLDPDLREDLAQLMARLTAETNTITIWVEHDQQLARRIADQTLGMEHLGELRAMDTPPNANNDGPQ